MPHTPPRLVDIAANLLAPAFRSDLAPVLARANAAGVLAAIVPGSTVPDSLAAITFCVFLCECGGQRRLLAAILDPDPIRRILLHLELPADPPAVAPARPPPALALPSM